MEYGRYNFFDTKMLADEPNLVNTNGQVRGTNQNYRLYMVFAWEGENVGNYFFFLSDIAQNYSASFIKGKIVKFRTPKAHANIQKWYWNFNTY